MLGVVLRLCGVPLGLGVGISWGVVAVCVGVWSLVVLFRFFGPVVGECLGLRVCLASLSLLGFVLRCSVVVLLEVCFGLVLAESGYVGVGVFRCLFGGLYFLALFGGSGCQVVLRG